MPAIYKLHEWIPDRWDCFIVLPGNHPVAYHSLESTQNMIMWYQLSGNSNAIHLLGANQDKINWTALSNNPNAIHLLEANPDKIHWIMLSGNPKCDSLVGSQSR